MRPAALALALLLFGTLACHRGGDPADIRSEGEHALAPANAEATPEKRAAKRKREARLLTEAKIADVAVGNAHVCALFGDGQVACWGDSVFSAIGPGNEGPGPVFVAGIEDATAIASGDHHACVLHRSGRVSCWGEHFTEYGDTQVSPLVEAGATGLVVGKRFACARQKTTYHCIGSLDHDYTGEAAPMLEHMDTVFAGEGTLCAVRDGEVSCFGQNFYKKLGLTGIKYASMVRAQPLDGLRHLALGYGHTCGVDKTGAVICRGSTIDGARGDGRPAELAPSLRETKDLNVGGKTMKVGVVKNADDLESWGQQLDRQEAAQLEPSQVSGLTEVVELAAGWDHMCARTKHKTVWCWGANEDGELGDGTREVRLVPVAATGVRDAVALDASGHTTCAASPTTIWCWGKADETLLGPDHPEGSAEPIRLRGFAQ